MPLLGELTARLSSWRVFSHQFRQVYARPEQFDEAHYRQHWELLRHNDGRRILAKIAGYMRERVRRGERWLGPLHRTTLPLTLGWGREDPVAVYAVTVTPATVFSSDAGKPVGGSWAPFPLVSR